MGYFVARYGENANERASYWHDNPKAEAILLIMTAVILTVLVFMGQRVWASIYFVDAPTNATIIEITGEQFAWNFHYAGAGRSVRPHGHEAHYTAPTRSAWTGTILPAKDDV